MFQKISKKYLNIYIVFSIVDIITMSQVDSERDFSYMNAFHTSENKTLGAIYQEMILLLNKYEESSRDFPFIRALKL